MNKHCLKRFKIFAKCRVANPLKILISRLENARYTKSYSKEQSTQRRAELREVVASNLHLNPHRLVGAAGGFCVAAAAAAAMEAAMALRSQADPRPLDMDMSPVISPRDTDRLLAPDSPCAEPAPPNEQ